MASVIAEFKVQGGQVSGFALFLLACSGAQPPEPTTSETRWEPSDVAPARRETCVRYPVDGGSVAVCGLDSSFRVKNESSNQLEVRSRVEVELEDQDGVWRPTNALVYLDPLCRPDPPTHRCGTLASGAVVQPYSWSGFSCSGQCRPRCSEDHYMRGYWLRFVVSTCDDTSRFAGPRFRLYEYEDVPL